MNNPVCSRIIGAFADPNETCRICGHKFSEHRWEEVTSQTRSDDDDIINTAIGVGLAESLLSSSNPDPSPPADSPAPDFSGGGGEFSGGGASGDF